MSFIDNHNESAETEKRLYTGVTPVELVGINPTQQELSKLFGGGDANAPTYVGTNDNGNKKIRLDMWLKNPDINLLTKCAIWLEDEARVSQAGNKQFINRKLQSTWGKSLEDIKNASNMQWFDTSTAREAKSGEVQLYEFLTALTNASTGQDDSDLELDDFSAIFDDDMNELNGINDAIGKQFKVLLGVKEGKYQDVYTGYFQKGSNNGTKVMENRACDTKYPYKADFQNSMELKEYNAPSAPAEDTTYVDMPEGTDTGNLF